jgi:hypothetical protein
MLRPIIQSDNAIPSLAIGLNIDFDNNNVNGTLTFNPSNLTTGRWDTATWDDDVWGGGLTTTKFWQGVSGIGYAAGINLTAAAQNIEVHWSSTDVVMEKGGVL